jgi:hypothetical protein
MKPAVLAALALVAAQAAPALQNPPPPGVTMIDLDGRAVRVQVIGLQDRRPGQPIIDAYWSNFAALMSQASPAARAEMAVFRGLLEADLADRDLRQVPAVPMVVLVAAKYRDVPLSVPFDLHQHFQADLRYRLGVLNEWVLASPHGTLVMANNTTHSIPRDDPGLIISAVQRVLDALSGAAADAFSALEERLLKAETVGLDFEVAAEGAFDASLRGALHIGPGDRMVLTASGTFGGKAVDVALRADGDELQIGGKTTPRPPHLKEAVLIGLTRMGILHNLARLTGGREPDHASGGVRDWVTVGAFATPAGATPALSFDIVVAGQAAGSASLEIDTTGRPVTRRQVVRFASNEMRVTERYSAVTITP